MKKKVFGAIAGAALYSLTLTTPMYSVGDHECKSIEITLENFMDILPEEGVYKYSNIREEGIAVSKHILVVKNPKFCDDGYDKDGNAYFFYIVDKGAGLKALITKAELDPCENHCLDADVKEFADWVKEEVKEGGGVDSIIDEYTKDC